MANMGPFSMVLLFEDQANSLQIVQSLREKGLDVHTVHSASELIQMIAGQKFDLVALSANHSSTASLVQVLKIKTHVAVLVFGEDSESATSKAILKSAADYQIVGAITSYNLWLKMGHLVKEKQRHVDAASRTITGRHRQETAEGAAMIIKSSAKGGEKKDDEKISVVKSTIKPKMMASSEEILVTDLQKTPAPKKEKKLLMGAKKKPAKIIHTNPDEEIVETGKVTVAAEESAPTTVKSTTLVRKTPLKVVGTGVSKPSIKEKVAVEEPQADAEETSKVIVKEKAAAPKGKLMKMGKAANKAKNDGKVLVREKPKESTSEVVVKTSRKEAIGEVMTEEQLIDKEIDQLQNIFFENKEDMELDFSPASIREAPKAAVGKVTLTEKPQHTESITVKGNIEQPGANELVEGTSSYETEEDKIISIEAARAHRKKQRQAQKVQKSVKAEPAKIENIDKLRFKKIFREAVAKAGETGFQKSENTKTIGVVTKVSLIPVDNMSEKGFIVMANNMNDFSTVDEVSGFKNSLLQEMQGFEEQDFSLGDTYNIDTFEVDVAAWAEKSSQFFYTYEDPQTGKQMLICFLRKESLFPEAHKMEAHKMYRIELHVLPPQTPVSFDAYLFLARNEKMLPYLRRGGSITGKQVQRLYQRGFKFLYIKDEEIRDYYSFYFSLYLHQDFRSERKLA